MFRGMRRFTRSALLFSAAQWAWHNRDDIKRQLQPVVTRGKELLAEVQSRRTGAPLAERPEPATTAVIVRTPASTASVAS